MSTSALSPSCTSVIFAPLHGLIVAKVFPDTSVISSAWIAGGMTPPLLELTSPCMNIIWAPKSKHPNRTNFWVFATWPPLHLIQFEHWDSLRLQPSIKVFHVPVLEPKCMIWCVSSSALASEVNGHSCRIIVSKCVMINYQQQNCCVCIFKIFTNLVSSRRWLLASASSWTISSDCMRVTNVWLHLQTGVRIKSKIFWSQTCLFQIAAFEKFWRKWWGE